jgi:histone demethylase JARID1
MALIYFLDGQLMDPILVETPSHCLRLKFRSSGWNPPFALNVDNPMKFQTKDQSIHRLQEGISFGDGDDYTLKEYQKMASEWSKEWKRRYYSAPSSANPNTETFDVVGDSNSHISLTSDKLESAECVVSYSPMAEAAPAHPIMTPESLERDYWDIVETQRLDVDVDYGNDVDTTEFGSGFPISERGRSVNSATFLAHGQSSVGGDDDQESLPEPEFGTEEFYKETYWNLNNIPNSKNSALRHLKVGINGINVPWLYFGSLFTTFCWHNEDNYMNSINYHHKGAPKQWYGVPGTKHDADGVERVFKSYLSMKMR